MGNIFDDLNKGRRFEAEEKKEVLKEKYLHNDSIMPASILGDKQEYRKTTGKIFESESKEREEHQKKVHKTIRGLEHSLMKPTKGLHFRKSHGGVF